MIEVIQSVRSLVTDFLERPIATSVSAQLLSADFVKRRWLYSISGRSVNVGLATFKGCSHPDAYSDWLKLRCVLNGSTDGVF